MAPLRVLHGEKMCTSMWGKGRETFVSNRGSSGRPYSQRGATVDRVAIQPSHAGTRCPLWRVCLCEFLPPRKGAGRLRTATGQAPREHVRLCNAHLNLRWVCLVVHGRGVPTRGGTSNVYGRPHPPISARSGRITHDHAREERAGRKPNHNNTGKWWVWLL